MSDEKKIAEPEITPDMIQAGLGALYRFHINDPDDDEMRRAVVAVFKSMFKAYEVCS
jgi:hypothetical protein